MLYLFSSPGFVRGKTWPIGVYVRRRTTMAEKRQPKRTTTRINCQAANRRFFALLASSLGTKMTVYRFFFDLWCRRSSVNLFQAFNTGFLAKNCIIAKNKTKVKTFARLDFPGDFEYFIWLKRKLMLIEMIRVGRISGD